MWLVSIGAKLSTLSQRILQIILMELNGRTSQSEEGGCWDIFKEMSYTKFSFEIKTRSVFLFRLTWLQTDFCSQQWWGYLNGPLLLANELGPFCSFINTEECMINLVENVPKLTNVDRPTRSIHILYSSISFLWLRSLKNIYKKKVLLWSQPSIAEIIDRIK